MIFFWSDECEAVKDKQAKLPVMHKMNVSFVLIDWYILVIWVNIIIMCLYSQLFYNGVMDEVE